MDYFQAKDIKQTSLAALIRNKPQEMGTARAFGSAIGDKFKASVTRFKSKFDPLNIAKTLTRSNTLTALVGRAMGRKRSDIAYFTGGRKYNTRIPERVASTDDALIQIKNTLDVIHAQLLKNYATQKQLDDTEKIEREERENERRRRDEQILEAHRAFLPKGLEVEEEKKGSIFDTIIGFMKTLVGNIGKMITGIVSGIMGTIKFIGTKIASAISGIFGAITGIVSYIKDILLTGITKAFDIFTDNFGKIGKIVLALGGALKSVFKTLSKIQKFITGARLIFSALKSIPGFLKAIMSASRIGASAAILGSPVALGLLGVEALKYMDPYNESGLMLKREELALNEGKLKQATENYNKAIQKGDQDAALMYDADIKIYEKRVAKSKSEVENLEKEKQRKVQEEEDVKLMSDDSFWNFEMPELPSMEPLATKLPSLPEELKPENALSSISRKMEFVKESIPQLSVPEMIKDAASSVAERFETATKQSRELKLDDMMGDSEGGGITTIDARSNDVKKMPSRPASIQGTVRDKTEILDYVFSRSHVPI